ncbi:hypothetical protein [Actinomadura rupiterrae]|uniref:hypothetical protein n=1 Tax=Actinomadura rupiterrae TaxID=559627 RepID=UPI0020A51E7E|nr:hypothetical protein [Actinomadura rupiterrae]MCP2337331.1 hypothetical protein [Actinomadura rupiterrae]
MRKANKITATSIAVATLSCGTSLALGPAAVATPVPRPPARPTTPSSPGERAKLKAALPEISKRLRSASGAPGAARPTMRAASAYPVWCGSWLRDPAVAYGKQYMNGSLGRGPNGAWTGMYEGYYGPHWFAWGYLQAPVGSALAVGWVYLHTVTYQCGDGNGNSQATVWSGTSTYTSGVRDDEATLFGAAAKVGDQPFQGGSIGWNG